MSIAQLLFLAALALLVGRLKRGRSLALLGVSALLIYWLQPRQEPVTLTFWLPTLTLILAFLAWLMTSTPEVRHWKQNWPAAALLVGVILLMDFNRYLRWEQVFVTATPRPQWLAVGLVALASVFLLVRYWTFPLVSFLLATAGLILLFLLIKIPSGFAALFETVSVLRGKAPGGFQFVSWLGFSYVAFRLIHTLLDRRAGRLPPVPLVAYVNYVIFFPSFVAGPIDRLERFLHDLHNPLPLDQAGWLEAGTRFFNGLFKKFVIADALAWIALSDALVSQINSSLWLWIVLYAYSLRIYFDFSGYTDLAIGMGRLVGVRLPENFASPYLKPNLAQFWNSWHMTLTQWFRSYFFNPLTRALRSAEHPLPLAVMIFLAQVSTMLLIGLWHGVTTGFVLWGLWHGLGLFIHNRWSAFMKAHTPAWGVTVAGERILRTSGIVLTFHFVSLGWLFFSLSTPANVWAAFAILFGVNRG